MADLTGTKSVKEKKTREERARKRTRAGETAEKDERARRSWNVRMAIIGKLCHLGSSLRNSTISDEDCQRDIPNYGLKL